MSLEDFLKFEERKKFWVVCPETAQQEIQKFERIFGKSVWGTIPKEIKRLFFLRRIPPRERTLSRFFGTPLSLDIQVSVERKNGGVVLVWRYQDILEESGERICTTTESLFRELAMLLDEFDGYCDMTDAKMWVEKFKRSLE
ncbi:hypothetical protein A9K97_gp347 [Tokyovirus A1]|uniref:hypothetical protein n=1 Tax=Tokyovirus A1 TaxID=1826170 RepID=UPI0007A969DC|nr:hypothetical protein A9K97_gp347 [Tokyovirus A1]BAU80004.1 hypothetical protein [Tokyovirus A1]